MLAPLGMTGSSFPASWPHEDPDAVTGYELEPDGTFVPDLDDLTAILLAAAAQVLARPGAGKTTRAARLPHCWMSLGRNTPRDPEPGSPQTGPSAWASGWSAFLLS